MTPTEEFEALSPEAVEMIARAFGKAAEEVVLKLKGRVEALEKLTHCPHCNEPVKPPRGCCIHS